MRPLLQYYSKSIMHGLVPSYSYSVVPTILLGIGKFVSKFDEDGLNLMEATCHLTRCVTRWQWFRLQVHYIPIFIILL